ncbi:MAG: DNA internalization-related competence protein ComEC/Rec2 [Rubrivivax sp.]
MRPSEPPLQTGIGHPADGPGPALNAATMALAWLAGVGLQLQQTALLQWPAAVALLLLGCAVSAACGWRSRRRLEPPRLHTQACTPQPDRRAGPASRPPVSLWMPTLMLALASAAVGFASTDLRAAWRLQQTLPAALEGEDLWVTGTVADLPRAGAGGLRFEFDTELATRGDAPVALPSRLSLGWYGDPADDPAFGGSEPVLRAGQRWRLPLRLRQPHGSLNPHGFDHELQLFERGIGAVGTVRMRPDALPQLLQEGVAHPLARLREALRDGIRARIADPAAAGVVAALAIGDQASIDRAGWDVFRTTGVSHLVSISGLHVTMVAWLVGALALQAWRLSPALMLRLPAPQAARIAGLLAALGYAALAGFGVPAQRTVGMIATVVLLRAAGLRWPLLAVLLAAALVVTWIDPWALLQPGFWLSFGAVALLLASEPAQVASGNALRPTAESWLRRCGHALRAGLRTQAVATVGLAPLTLVFFQQISVVGFAANIVAIPLVTLLITPLALAGVLLPLLWPLAGWLVQGLLALLQLLAAWPAALWTAAVAPPWAMAAGLLGGLLAIAPLPWRLRLLALPLMLPLLLPPVARPPQGAFELVAADIGQGTAVLVRTQRHLLLFDTGPAYSADADAGGRVLLPLLRARGEPRIDLLMLSHRDADHVGGAPAVLAGIRVDAISSSLIDNHPLLSAPPASAARPPPPHRRCLAGQQWEWDGVRFQVLQPGPWAYADATLKPNAMSCVLQVQGASHSALLTGDIEARQEAALVSTLGDSLRSQVLLVPHHGSRTSSTADFINTVRPRVAVVQAAYRSRFGHPAPDVVARYAVRGIELVRSDRCGAWTLAGDGTANCERDTARRYWHYTNVPPPTGRPSQ